MADDDVPAHAYTDRLGLSVPSLPALATALEGAATEFDEAIALLAACGVADCWQLPIGIADRLLLSAHRAVLGSDMEAVARCEVCGVLNALPLGPDDVPPHRPRTAWCGPGAGMREPTCADLAGLPADAVAAARELEVRCRVGPSAEERDGAALDRAEQSLCGNVTVPCTECRADVTRFVDVQYLVLEAVATAVAEMDMEVHLLASQYGWDLTSIEALPDARRSRLAALVGRTPR